MNHLAAKELTNPALGPSLQAMVSEPITFFQAAIPALITLAFIVGSIVFVFMLIVGGIQWMGASGDKAALEAARGRIVQALIGIVILFSAYAIVALIEVFFGTNLTLLNLAPIVIQ